MIGEKRIILLDANWISLNPSRVLSVVVLLVDLKSQKSGSLILKDKDIDTVKPRWRNLNFLVY